MRLKVNLAGGKKSFVRGKTITLLCLGESQPMQILYLGNTMVENQNTLLVAEIK